MVNRYVNEEERKKMELSVPDGHETGIDDYGSEMDSHKLIKHILDAQNNGVEKNVPASSPSALCALVRKPQTQEALRLQNDRLIEAAIGSQEARDGAIARLSKETKGKSFGGTAI